MIKKNLCLMVCENYKREAAAVLKAGDFADVRLYTYPAVCNSPNDMIHALSAFIPSGRSSCGRIVFIGGDCSGRFNFPPAETAEFRPRLLEQCFHMFASKEIIDWQLKEGAYLITPGFLYQWRQGFEDMKFDQKSARKFFKRSSKKLVLLDTGAGKNIDSKLQEFAEFLDLPFETVPAGRDFFRMFLKEIVLEWRLEKGKPLEEQIKTTTVKDTDRRAHNRVMIARKCLVEINDSEMVELKDISLGGIRLGVPVYLPADSVYSVKIYPSIKKEIQLKGTAVWSSSKETPAGSLVYETGIKFLEMNKASLNSLKKFFKTITL